MEYKIVTDQLISKEAWIRYVDSHINGTIFHRPEMVEAYDRSPDFKPFALFATDKSGNIQAMLVGYIQILSKGFLATFAKRAVLPVSPIADNDESMSFLLKRLIRYTRFKSIYLEIRNHYDVLSLGIDLSKLGFMYEKHLNILVDLTKSEDELLNDMSTNRRKEIKKSEKESFEFIPDDPRSEEGLYSILKEIYSRANLPLVSESLFQNMYRSLGSMHQVCGLYYDDDLVGAVLVLLYKGTAYGYFGGSKEEYFKKRPNDLMFWKTFCWLKDHGYQCFDWMGAGNPDKPYGVRDWKKQFGGEFVSYGRHHYYQFRYIYRIAEFVFNLMRKRIGNK